MGCCCSRNQTAMRDVAELPAADVEDAQLRDLQVRRLVDNQPSMSLKTAATVVLVTNPTQQRRSNTSTSPQPPRRASSMPSYTIAPITTNPLKLGAASPHASNGGGGTTATPRTRSVTSIEDTPLTVRRVSDATMGSSQQRQHTRRSSGSSSVSPQASHLRRGSAGSHSTNRSPHPSSQLSSANNSTNMAGHPGADPPDILLSRRSSSGCGTTTTPPPRSSSQILASRVVRVIAPGEVHPAKDIAGLAIPSPHHQGGGITVHDDLSDVVEMTSVGEDEMPY